MEFLIEIWNTTMHTQKNSYIKFQYKINYQKIKVYLHIFLKFPNMGNYFQCGQQVKRHGKNLVTFDKIHKCQTGRGKHYFFWRRRAGENNQQVLVLVSLRLSVICNQIIISPTTKHLYTTQPASQQHPFKTLSHSN